MYIDLAKIDTDFYHFKKESNSVLFSVGIHTVSLKLCSGFILLQNDEMNSHLLLFR